MRATQDANVKYILCVFGFVGVYSRYVETTVKILYSKVFLFVQYYRN